MKKSKTVIIILIFTIVGLPITFYTLNLDKFIIITTPSMVPTINIGDMVYFEFKDPSEIHADPVNGDILVMKGLSYFYDHGVDPQLYNNLSGDIPMIHRAVNRIYNEAEQIHYYETRGDNTLYSDGCVKGSSFDGNGSLSFNISDPILIPETEIIGVVEFIIPYLGYLGIFSHQIAIIITLIFVFTILFNIFNYYLKKIKNRSSNS